MTLLRPWQRPLARRAVLALTLGAAASAAGLRDAAPAGTPCPESPAGVATAERLAMADRLAQGTMGKFRFAQTEATTPELNLHDLAGQVRTLSSWRGKTVLLNLWASWCEPCRQELPSLQALQGRLPGPDFAIVTVSIDHKVEEARLFLQGASTTGLTVLLDPTLSTLKALGAEGVPTSILIDPQGRETGRLSGSADWSSDEAVVLIEATMLSGGSPACAGK